MLTNPVLISVLVMCGLCLFRVNIMVSIIIAAMVAGLMANMGIADVMTTLIGGMGGNAETALSYILLGALAFGIQSTGLATKLCTSLERLFGRKGMLFLVVLAIISCFSQNLIPIHIAFIPVLIPPLLKMMNDLNLDRRGAACALTFGLVTPYMVIPAGFGLIFHGIIANEVARNGLEFARADVWKAMLVPSLGMVVGLLVAIFITYRKPREYQNIDFAPVEVTDDAQGKLSRKQWGALAGALTAVTIQLLTGSLPLGALCGLGVMVLFGSIGFRDVDKTLNEGVCMLGFIGFVMMVAAGYGDVIRATNGVEQLVTSSLDILGGSKFIGANVLLLLGLIITLGLGSSFATLPVIAVIYVPICLSLGFSPMATVILVGTAGALGDAGSPASSTTLGTTAGLNADGQHDHIWDTCVPTFLHFNVGVYIFGLAAAMFA